MNPHPHSPQTAQKGRAVPTRCSACGRIIRKRASRARWGGSWINHARSCPRRACAPDAPLCTCQRDYEARERALEANVDRKYLIAENYQTCCIGAVRNCPRHGPTTVGQDGQQIVNKYGERERANAW